MTGIMVVAAYCDVRDYVIRRTRSASPALRVCDHFTFIAKVAR